MNKMEKIELPQQKMSPNFIGSWCVEPKSVCDRLIDLFESRADQQSSGVSGGIVNKQAKNSVDMTVYPKDLDAPGNEVFKSYFESLFACYRDYILQWPLFKEFGGNLEIGAFNLQKYGPGQHFQKVHAERGSLATLHRVLAWMTYLNDLEPPDGGATYFNHYDLEVQPKKGLTLIWPAEWTHAHCGNAVVKGPKYIITGWLHFPE